MLIKIIIIYILNLFDLVATQILIDQCGPGVEANPIGQFLFQTGLVYFVKVGLVAALLAGLYLIYRKATKSKKLVVILTDLMQLVFSCLTVYPIVLLSLLK